MPRLEHVYECQGYRSFGKDGDTRARPEMTESRARVHTGQVEVTPILAGEICCLLPVYLSSCRRLPARGRGRLRAPGRGSGECRCRRPGWPFWGWSLRRTAAAPHTAGCGPRRAPLRGAVSPFHGVARAAQPLPEPPRPLRGPAMVSRSPAKRTPRVHSAFCVTKLRRPLRISRHLRSEKHGPAAHQPGVRRASPSSKHRHWRSARQAGKGPAWPRQAGVESVAPLA